jgi:hypothetical protein
MKKISIFFTFFVLQLLVCRSISAQNSPVIYDREEDEDARHPASPGYFKQWFEKHKNAEGIIPSGLHLKWYERDLAKFALPQPETESAIVSVEQLAPNSPQGGRTRGLLIDQRDENVIFAGSVGGGLWRSNNAGTTWTAINDAAATLAVTAICQNPRKPTEIYYGTGETRGPIDNFGGAGVYKSTDGGLTFSVLPSTIGTSTVGIDMRYCNYIAHSLTQDSTVFVGTTSGLYRSVNGGSTWEKVLVGSNSGILCYPDGRVLASVQAGGIYMSPTGSSGSFTKIDEPTFPTNGTGRILLANCKSFPNVVYAFFTYNGTSSATFRQEGNNGLFKSSDFGATWTKKSDSLSSIYNARVGPTQGAYDQLLGVHPTDTNRVVIGATVAKRSVDGGRTFADFAYGHADVHTFSNIGTGDNFLIASDGGVWRVPWYGTVSKDLGAGYTTFQFYAGNYNPTGKIAIGGLQDNGTWKHINSSLVRVNGGDGGYSHISQQNPDLAYYSYVDGETYRSEVFTTGTNAGSFATYPITPSATTLSEGVDFINQFEINYADGKQLYFRTAKGLWRSTNSGTSWLRINPSTNNLSGIQAIGVENKANPAVYIGGAQCFYRFDSAATLDPATTFYVSLRTSVPTEIKPDAWGTISFHPSVSSTLLVGLTTMSPNPRAWRVNKANTAAPEWVSISGDLPSTLPVYQVQAHPDKPDSVLFAATAFGLYCSVNGGKNWTKETRIPNVAINEMKLRASDRTLFLFTHGRGMFYLTLKDYLTPTKEIAEKTDIKIYPNPTTDVLNISSKGPLSMVQVFDIKGREIITEKTSLTTIPVGILPTGVYFVRVFDTNGRFATMEFVKN